MADNSHNKTTNTRPPLPIHYEDDDLLVVIKPTNLLSQKDETGDPDVYSLCQAYLSRGKSRPADVGLVHRLDRPVSGLMVLAKNTSAARLLSEQIRNQTMQKSYWTIVCGSVPPNGVLTHYLKKNASTNVVTAVSKKDTDAQYAELAYQRLDYKKKFSLLDIHLQTGRSHQIRVQLSTDGYPIWGDQKYGSGSCGDRGSQLALFAYRLGFVHPKTEQEITLAIPPPLTYPWNLFQENFPD